MNEQLQNALARYEKASVEMWDVRDREHAAMQDMNAALAPQRRAWGCRVRRAMKGARPEWQVIKTGLYFAVDHSHRPYDGHVSCKVELLWSAGGPLRGRIEIYGDYAEQEKILDELRKVVKK